MSYLISYDISDVVLYDHSDNLADPNIPFPDNKSVPETNKNKQLKIIALPIVNIENKAIITSFLFKSFILNKLLNVKI